MRKITIPILLVCSTYAIAQENKPLDSTKTANIQEVVVTALGIKRQAKSLTYSSQTIGGDDLTDVKTPNLLNSINGKVSNVQINKTNGGVGGSVRITMRGDKSVRNSQPLFVIDGMPISNRNTNSPGVDLYTGMPDGGDVMSSINPEDIESINFLKGPSASALYGYEGGNGVVLITTKKGSKGRSKISYSTNLTFDNVFSLPKFQNSYLQTNPFDAATGSTGSQDSWGAKGNSKDYVKDFFQTGSTWNNSLTFQSGNEKTTNFFSIANTTNKGVIPTQNFDQYNLNYSNTSKFFNDKLTLDANVMASMQTTKNRLAPGTYFSPLTNLYWMPRGINFDNYSGDNYMYFNEDRYLPAQNWWAIKEDGSFNVESQNPYWILNRNVVSTKNKNFYGSAALSYQINSWLIAKVRGNYNYFDSQSQRNVNVYSLPVVMGGNNNGKVYKNLFESRTTYADALLIGNPKISDNVSVSFTLGTSISDKLFKTTQIENNKLTVANLFADNNLQWPGQNGNGLLYTIFQTRDQTQSVFASANIGYKNMLFLDLTFRNDWSSTLAGTNNVAFDYESIGVNAILSEMITLPESINFWKIRASYATVGNGLKPTSPIPQMILNAGTLTGEYSSSPVTNHMFNDLFPQSELNKSFEIGTEFRFFNNRLAFDFTYYNSNATNQYLIGIDAISNFGVDAGKVDINAGKINNKGFESTLSYKAFDTEKFKWVTTVNASANKNTIKELFPSNYYADPNKIFQLLGGGYNYLKLGGSFGDIYGKTFKRNENGNIIVNENGVPLEDGDKKYLGNPNPKFILGFSNSFSIGKVNFDFLVDGKFGGHVLGYTEMMNDRYGVSKATGDARDRGGVSITNAVKEDGTAYSGTTDAQKYYIAVSNIEEAYMYKATAIRLRQAAISYTFKMRSDYMRDLTLGVTGSNLFFFYKKAPFDPEQVSGVNAGGVGVDMFGLPTTRSYGISLKANF